MTNPDAWHIQSAVGYQYPNLGGDTRIECPSCESFTFWATYKEVAKTGNPSSILHLGPDKATTEWGYIWRLFSWEQSFFLIVHSKGRLALITYTDLLLCTPLAVRTFSNFWIGVADCEQQCHNPIPIPIGFSLCSQLSVLFFAVFHSHGTYRASYFLCAGACSWLVAS